MKRISKLAASSCLAMTATLLAFPSGVLANTLTQGVGRNGTNTVGWNSVTTTTDAGGTGSVSYNRPGSITEGAETINFTYTLTLVGTGLAPSTTWPYILGAGRSERDRGRVWAMVTPVIHGLSVPAGPGPQISVIGLNGSGEIEVQASGPDPAKSYTLVRGSNLVSFPDTIESSVTGVSDHTFTDSTPPTGQAFYRLEWTP